VQQESRNFICVKRAGQKKMRKLRKKGRRRGEAAEKNEVAMEVKEYSEFLV